MTIEDTESKFTPKANAIGTAKVPSTPVTRKSKLAKKTKRRPVNVKRRKKRKMVIDSSSDNDSAEEEQLEDTEHLTVVQGRGQTIKLQLQGIKLDQLILDQPVKLGKRRKFSGQQTSSSITQEEPSFNSASPELSSPQHCTVEENVDYMCDQGNNTEVATDGEGTEEDEFHYRQEPIVFSNPTLDKQLYNNESSPIDDNLSSRSCKENPSKRLGFVAFGEERSFGNLAMQECDVIEDNPAEIGFGDQTRDLTKKLVDGYHNKTLNVRDFNEDENMNDAFANDVVEPCKSPGRNLIVNYLNSAESVAVSTLESNDAENCFSIIPDIAPNRHLICSNSNMNEKVTIGHEATAMESTSHEQHTSITKPNELDDLSDKQDEETTSVAEQIISSFMDNEDDSHCSDNEDVALDSEAKLVANKSSSIDFDVHNGPCDSNIQTTRDIPVIDIDVKTCDASDCTIIDTKFDTLVNNTLKMEKDFDCFDEFGIDSDKLSFSKLNKRITKSAKTASEYTTSLLPYAENKEALGNKNLRVEAVMYGQQHMDESTSLKHSISTSIKTIPAKSLEDISSLSVNMKPVSSSHLNIITSSALNSTYVSNNYQAAENLHRRRGIIRAGSENRINNGEHNDILSSIPRPNSVAVLHRPVSRSAESPFKVISRPPSAHLLAPNSLDQFDVQQNSMLYRSNSRNSMIRSDSVDSFLPENRQILPGSASTVLSQYKPTEALSRPNSVQIIHPEPLRILPRPHSAASGHLEPSRVFSRPGSLNRSNQDVNCAEIPSTPTGFGQQQPLRILSRPGSRNCSQRNTNVALYSSPTALGEPESIQLLSRSGSVIIEQKDINGVMHHPLPTTSANQEHIRCLSRPNSVNLDHVDFDNRPSSSNQPLVDMSHMPSRPSSVSIISRPNSVSYLQKPNDALHGSRPASVIRYEPHNSSASNNVESQVCRIVYVKAEEDCINESLGQTMPTLQSKTLMPSNSHVVMKQIDATYPEAQYGSYSGHQFGLSPSTSISLAPGSIFRGGDITQEPTTLNPTHHQISSAILPSQATDYNNQSSISSMLRSGLASSVHSNIVNMQSRPAASNIISSTGEVSINFTFDLSDIVIDNVGRKVLKVPKTNSAGVICDGCIDLPVPDSLPSNVTGFIVNKSRIQKGNKLGWSYNIYPK